jgi:opacity protein-like surface antigen
LRQERPGGAIARAARIIDGAEWDRGPETRQLKRMKKLIAVLAFVFLIGTTGVLAAEWKGFYVGGAIAGAESTPYWTDVDFDWNGSTLQLPSNGLLYGVVVGYNFQPDGVVYGIELDLNFSSIENFTRYSDDVDCTDDLNSLYALKGRIAVPAGNALLYATVGAAMVDAEHSWIEDNDPTDSWDSIDGSNLGYVYGVGVEHQWSDLISFKVEYSQSSFAPESDENQDGFTFKVSEHVDAVTVGLNFNLTK